jgi:hypothetical protein
MENKTTDTAIIDLILNTWTSRNTAVTHFFGKYRDEAYEQTIAPGRNRAVYLFGHLIATNDALLPLLGFGDKLFPELEAFGPNPDSSFSTLPPVAELKEKWEIVNQTLSNHFNQMTPQDWLGRHMNVSEEDFAKEPQRNKLNVLLGRTNHQSYHLGQLNLLTVRELVA